MDAKGKTHLCHSPVALAEHRPETTQSGSRLLYLIIVRGGIPGTMLRLAQEASSLGRSAENTFQIHDHTVSRRHAVIWVDGDGSAWITDVGSSNGTFVDGRRLPLHTPIRVNDGGRIQLGSATLLKFLKLDPCDEGFQREMFERIVRDSLTGLYNRGYFLNQVGPLCDLVAGRSLGLAIILIDLDHFKRINDTYGHDAGDRVLREVAQVLRESTRSDDLIARYGGEEFILALPSSSLQQASERAERIRQALGSLEVDVDGFPIRLTASLGLAFDRSSRAQNLAALITKADESLYEAKRQGRNRVIAADHFSVMASSRTDSAEAVVLC
ncbi:MAG: GGDEF domain-containing protein [Isosphaeraceae bacterium]